MSYIHCGQSFHTSKFYVSKAEKEMKEAKEITFTNKGKIHTAKAKVYNDAFYEILSGKFKKSLVHIFNVTEVKEPVKV